MGKYGGGYLPILPLDVPYRYHMGVAQVAVQDAVRRSFKDLSGQMQQKVSRIPGMGKSMGKSHGIFLNLAISHDFMINCYGNLVILWICNILIWCVEAIKSMRYGLWNRNRFNWAIYTRTVFGSEHVFFLRILPSGNWIVGNIKINQFRGGGYLSMAIFKCNPFRTMSGSTQKTHHRARNVTWGWVESRNQKLPCFSWKNSSIKPEICGYHAGTRIFDS